MWKVLSKHFILFFISLLVLVLVVFPYCAERLVSRIVLNKYLKQEYHLLYNEMKVDYLGNHAHANIQGIHGDRHRWWISAYEIKTPFMDRTFEIWVDKNNYKIFGSDFYEQLSYDEKFHHLYSNWIKKQIELDDENIDIEVSCNEIRFDEIEKYETEEDIFQYTSGSIDEIRIKTEKSNEIGAYDEKFREFENKYVEKLYDINVECAYRFVLMGEDEEIYLDYKIDEYRNNYSNECYRTKYTWECNDELWIKVQEFLRSEESERAEKFNGIAKILKK